MGKKVSSVILVLLLSLLIQVPAFANETIKTSICPLYSTIDSSYTSTCIKIAKLIYDKYNSSDFGKKVDYDIGIKSFDGEDPRDTLFKVQQLLRYCYKINIDGIGIQEAKSGYLISLRGIGPSLQDEIIPEVEDEVDELLGKALKYKSVREQLAYINDTLANRVEYKYSFVPSINNVLHMILVDKKGDCGSIAEALSVLCDKLDIKNIIMFTNVHAANLIYLDGEWHLWDLTANINDTPGLKRVYDVLPIGNKIKAIEVPAERTRFLVPVDSITFEHICNYLHSYKLSPENWSFIEAEVALKYPELSQSYNSTDYNDIVVDVDQLKKEIAEAEGLYYAPQTPPVQPNENQNVNESKPVIIDNTPDFILDSSGHLKVVPKK